MKITKEQLDAIMRRWVAYAYSIGIKDGDMGYIAAEQAFVFGAITQILDCTVGEVMLTDLPPVVGMCFMSGRPLSSVGNWDTNQDAVRLAGASQTW